LLEVGDEEPEERRFEHGTQRPDPGKPQHAHVAGDGADDRPRRRTVRSRRRQGLGREPRRVTQHQRTARGEEGAPAETGAGRDGER
jgi:hypothetical protein